MKNIGKPKGQKSTIKSGDHAKTDVPSKERLMGGGSRPGGSK